MIAAIVVAADEDYATRARFYDEVRAGNYAAAADDGEAYLKKHPGDDRFALDVAYAELNAGRRDAAIARLKVLSTSSDAKVADAATKQLATMGPANVATPSAFYDDVRAKNYAAAVEVGQAYLKDHPNDDQFALDVAYAEINAGMRDAATSRLKTLSSSSNAQVAEAATKQLAAMNPATPTMAAAPQRYQGTHGYAYAYADYESRFADLFNGGLVRYDLGRPAWAVPYLAFHLTYDTRSGVPGAAQIYNDNAAVFNGGVRVPLGVYGYAFAEGGYSQGLRSQRSFPEDRFGFAFSRDYGSTALPQPHLLLDGSLAEYSRFAGNIIGYAQTSYDVSVNNPPLRAIAGAALTFDAHRLYYNNYAEGYAGLLVRASPIWSLRAVALTGTYLTRGIDPPLDRSYRGFRVLGVLGVNVK